MYWEGYRVLSNIFVFPKWTIILGVTYRLVRCYVSTLSSSIQLVRYPTFKNVHVTLATKLAYSASHCRCFYLVKVESVAYNSNVNIPKPLRVSVPLETALLVSEAASLKNERITTLMTACYVRFTPIVWCPLYKKDLLSDLMGFISTQLCSSSLHYNAKMLHQKIDSDRYKRLFHKWIGKVINYQK